jgi:hypothetical protein
MSRLSEITICLLQVHEVFTEQSYDSSEVACWYKNNYFFFNQGGLGFKIPMQHMFFVTLDIKCVNQAQFSIKHTQIFRELLYTKTLVMNIFKRNHFCIRRAELG